MLKMSVRFRLSAHKVRIALFSVEGKRSFIIYTIMKWTQTEIEMILSMVKEGKTYKEISIVVNRNESAIRSKLFKLGEKWTNYVDFIKEHICQQCGNKFTDLQHIDRKFCSKSCSATYFNLKRDNEIREFKSCLNCDKQIKGKYCNYFCQRQYEKNIIFSKIENGDTSLQERQYKKYLILKFGNKCMECGWGEVHPVTGNVPIQLEHIDGHSENNNLSNLKLLCPNCHSLTPTFGSLNRGNGRKKDIKQIWLYKI